VGQIQVKYDFSKLKMKPDEDGPDEDGPDVARGP